MPKLADKMAGMKSKKIKMPNGEMMTEEEMNRKFGEMTPNIGMKRYIKKDVKKDMKFVKSSARRG